MRKFFRRIAVFFVTAQSKRVYESAKRCAEFKHEQTGRRVFVITNQEDSKEMLVITDKEFLEMRHKMGIASKDCTVDTLRQQAWYHTANENEKGTLSERETEIRKRAFIKDCVENAGLI